MRKSIGLLAMVLFVTVLMALSLQSVGAADLKGTVNLVGSTSVQPLAEELAKAFMTANPGVTITVAGGGSGAGIKAAQMGTADIGTCSRELKPEEEAGITTTVIAKDGIAVIVNKRNRVTGLSLEQAAKIYTAQISNWSEVGGAKAPIILISREAGSGTRGAFEELVLGKTPPTTNMLVQGSTGAVRETISVTPNAIGYMSLGDLDRTVKALTINKVKPTQNNVINKTYPLARPFLFLTKGAPQGLIKTFIDWVLSPAGQVIVAKNFVPIGKTR